LLRPPFNFGHSNSTHGISAKETSEGRTAALTSDRPGPWPLAIGFYAGTIYSLGISAAQRLPDVRLISERGVTFATRQGVESPWAAKLHAQALQRGLLPRRVLSWFLPDGCDLDMEPGVSDRIPEGHPTCDFVPRAKAIYMPWRRNSTAKTRKPQNQWVGSNLLSLARSASGWRSGCDAGLEGLRQTIEHATDKAKE